MIIRCKCSWMRIRVRFYAMFSFRILFLFVAWVFLLCGVCECELTLFVKRINTNTTRYNFTCVATGDSMKSALTWLPKNLERDVQRRSRYTSEPRNEQIKMCGWSLNFYMPPVLDYRWESFPTIIIKGKTSIITKPETNVSSANLSILFRNSFIVILHTNETKYCATVLERHRKSWQTGQNLTLPFKEYHGESFNNTFIELNYAKWMHLTIFKNKDNFYLGDLKEDGNYETFDMLHLEVDSPIGQVKLHKYEIFSGKLNDIKTCLSFYVFTNGKCSGLKDSSKREWIPLNTTDKNINLDVTKDCLISGMRYCRMNETRSMYLESDDTDVLCASLEKNTPYVYYKIPTKHNPISPSDGDYVTCNLKSGCFCLGNRTGNFCETGPNRVRNIKAFNHSINSVIVRWEPPDLQPHEEVDLYKVIYSRNEYSNDLTDTYNCGLYVYIKLKDLAQNVLYNISIFTKVKEVEGFGLPENSSFILGKTLTEHPKCRDVKEYDTKELDTISWIKRNILYFSIIVTAAGVALLCVCSWIIYSYRKSSTRSKSDNHEHEDSIPLYPCNSVILNRQDVSNVLKLWVHNNVDDSHIQNEFTYVDKKNRSLYRAIVDKDVCRVKVKDVANDTEVNAHFIQGCKGDKTYIATQCPKNNKMGEAFWMIIWDEKVSIIVSLLTKEESVEKPYDYWTNGNWNAIKVKVNFTLNYSDFVMRNLTITRLEDARKVIQFNYFTWPHNGIPVNPLSFVNFLKYVKSKDVQPNPMLVHCSEGFGRTGTYIMCDYFINTPETILNVSKYLEVICKCRPYIVKNFLQYKFVYFVIDELNSNRETEVNSSSFLSRCAEIMETNLPRDNAYIKTRRYIYKLLYSDEDYTNLNSNWTVVPGYQNENTYYVTQQPSFDNVHLFWEFVYSNKIRHVLILQSLCVEKGKFWPSQDEPMEFETLDVKMINYHRDHFVKIYRVEVQRRNEESIEVVLLHFKDWERNQKVPGSENKFYEFYKTFDHMKSPRDNKTVICCHNGATASGLFICFDLIFKKWKSDNVFDLVWAVLSIKHRQEYFMDKLVQHQFIYKLFEYFLINVEKHTSYNEYSSMSHNCPIGYDTINGNSLQ